MKFKIIALVYPGIADFSILNPTEIRFIAFLNRSLPLNYINVPSKGIEPG
jgi:hypothetical protein